MGHTDQDKERLSHHLRSFYSYQVEGIIILGYGLAEPEIVKLAFGDKPIVLSNCYVEDSFFANRQSGKRL
jgi:DNA-binding LacI/PurR family transcriptional regulator